MEWTGSAPTGIRPVDTHHTTAGLLTRTEPAPEGLDSAHASVLGIQQPVIDHLLEEHAIELGAPVRRGCTVTGFEQDHESVAVDSTDGERLRSRLPDSSARRARCQELREILLLDSRSWSYRSEVR
ncbi:FAD-dependent monooxygenase [Nocardia sp. NPDC051463]|uniref:FAD-dependent monooxygenase n=1 Tax=Nocardia sp. NPDC051463 TaxID=3154845 RepID=UPI0034472EFB